MARGRKQLTDKQERILVQCQLMGLTPRDMQQISNRLIALEKEAAFKKEVAEITQGLEWEKTTNGYKVTESDGKIYEFSKEKHTHGSRAYYERSGRWNVTITKPGTRFKPKTVSGTSIYEVQGLTAKICPGNSKDLFGLIKALKARRFD